MRSDGKYGFIENGGDNSASDADSDIALALILASRRWNDKKYIGSAEKILADMWNIETATASGKRYLVAGNWAKLPDRLVINPSYFSPYAWRIFSKVDTKHNWDSLITPAYVLLNDASTLPLNKDKAVGLPPNWVALTTDGVYLAPDQANLTTDYSLDAMRIPWRIAVDYRWNNDPEAKKYLAGMCPFIIGQYKKNGQLGSSYEHNGNELNANESPAFYAANLPCFEMLDKNTAADLYQKKVGGLYSNATNSFNSDLSYYDQNWLWFAAAFHFNKITNFK
jgi:endoglucanase